MTRLAGILIACAALLARAAPALTQDLGPHVRKIADGIYVYAAKPADANVSIILTTEGPVLIDTGQTPADARVAMEIVKKLTTQPVRFVIHTEPHADHTSGDFVFSPPATVIAHAGAAEEMKQSNLVARNEKLMAAYPELRAALEGYRMVLPHIEFKDRMTLNVGGRTLELIFLRNVHSTADTAIWLPSERILWATAAVGVKRYPNLRPYLTIPDILASIKLMRGLNPQVVIAGHGPPGTTQIFDEMERYYAVLLEGVGKLVRESKSLEQVKTELRLPGFDDWSAKERFSTNVDAAWKAVKQ
jgi:cyclase